MLLARLVADLPKLKAAVETKDPPTVRPIAEDYRRQLDADLLLVTDRHGALLVGDGNGAHARRAAAVSPTALDGPRGGGVLAAPDGMLQVVTVPIAIGRDTPDILGTLSVGFLLDNRRAAQFKRATAATSRSRRAGAIRGATLPPERAPRAGRSRARPTASRACSSAAKSS